ncbi:uncharacterized protein LOC105799202 [Gossypium raimondii]|uniref:uncharacterized protein LOC105799202 n=1 Tax=Gossypium raimondii TaxID=29730 RepID=UPI00227AB0B8|nr:uncharacterized protein LOC105799202 [Gossypium raimondii]
MPEHWVPTIHNIDLRLRAVISFPFHSLCHRLLFIVSLIFFILSRTRNRFPESRSKFVGAWGFCFSLQIDTVKSGILSRLDIRLSFYIGGEPTSRIAGLFVRILCWNALSSLMISIFKEIRQTQILKDE